MRTAETVARECRQLLWQKLDEGAAHWLKADGSFVTEIDLAVEDHVRRRLGEAFPDHGILGEERPETAAASPYRWVIDPIDGTKSLRLGIPLFGTLLALQYDGAAVLGLIDLRSARARGGRCLPADERGDGRGPSGRAIRCHLRQARRRGLGVPDAGGQPMIRKLSDGRYRLYSRKKNPKTGRRRNLGTFKTRAAAERHERAVQFFKRGG